MSETRYSEIDTAGAGQGQKRLEGVVMRYGALAQLPDGRQERFLPGAFGPDVGTQDVISIPCTCGRSPWHVRAGAVYG